MAHRKTAEKPLGVYLVALYFVLTGFLEPIQKYREWATPIQLSPFAEHSIWQLAADTAIYLGLAYLVWHLTWLGRLAALVFGYLYLATNLWFFILYARGTPMNSTPLFSMLAAYHVVSLPFLLYYLQTEPREKLFQGRLLDILLPKD